ncbi:transcriptional regulator, partial [Escherichia coli]|nr:transcriptional regulator [Escherichia coli]
MASSIQGQENVMSQSEFDSALPNGIELAPYLRM